jgi:uncharacterized protein (TIGR02271 family)
MSRDNYINWRDVVKKEAKARDGEDLGEVQEVGQHYVMVQKGLISKQRYYFPKTLVQGWDGETLWFACTEDEAKTSFARESPDQEESYAKYRRDDIPEPDREIETRVPVIEERLKVSKTVSESEATIRKEPYSETKRVEVPVTHDELEIERRPVSSETSTATEDRPVTSAEDIRVPLKSEEVQVTKEPFVKEEVAIRKKPVTETKEVEEEVRGERVDVDK